MKNSDTLAPLAPSAFHRFVQSLPKAEMHLHLEGALPLELCRKASGLDAHWMPDSWAPDCRFNLFSDFEHFILSHAGAWFTSPERYADACSIIFQGKLKEGVRYLECSFAAIVSQMTGMPIDEIVDAILSVVPEGLQVRLFMGLHHDGWVPQMENALTKALDLKSIDGIDLHGHERYPVADWMLEYWPAARASGKFTKAHAGELGGASHVREAIEKLGVVRVEHGFKAVEDASVMELLKKHSVVLDICPISNYKLRTVDSYEGHPIRQLTDSGIVCTVNTDDPFVFGNTINDEYEVLHERAGFSRAEIVQLIRNALKVALMSSEDRDSLLSELEKKAEDV